MSKKGFTLIEAAVAIFLLTTGTVGAFTLIQRTTAFSSIASSKLVASYLSQEGVEVVRNIRDSNWLADDPWNQGLGVTLNRNVDYDSVVLEDETDNLVLWGTMSGTGWRYRHYEESSCVDGGAFYYPDGDSCQAGAGCCLDTQFSRHIEISYPDASTMEVKSVVSWEERGRSHDVTAQTKLYNWR